MSEPWSGSVMAQQPSFESGASRRQKSLPRTTLMKAGSSPAPNEMARPESPQPSSSNMMHIVLARSAGSRLSSVSTPKPSSTNFSLAGQYGDSGAMASSG